jgi:hypothetical protein
VDETNARDCIEEQQVYENLLVICPSSPVSPEDIPGILRPNLMAFPAINAGDRLLAKRLAGILLGRHLEGRQEGLMSQRGISQ